MNEITYETKPYCEFIMNDAVREYDEKLSVSAFEIAVLIIIGYFSIFAILSKYDIYYEKTEVLK